MKRSTWGLAVATLVVGLGGFWLWQASSTLSDQRAEDLVREYNRCVIEAFRLSDPSKVDAVTGPAEGKKILGLIGAKSDMGLTLDAKLLELKVVRVDRNPDAIQVDTVERWHYADRRIGDGTVQGAPSDDSYAMRYFLAKSGQRWVVDHIAFAADPVVGRAAILAQQPAGIQHGKGATTPPSQVETKP